MSFAQFRTPKSVAAGAAVRANDLRNSWPVVDARGVDRIGLKSITRRYHMNPLSPPRSGRRAGNGAEQPTAAATIPGATRAETIEECIVRSLHEYFANLGGKPHALHELVLQAVERPLLKFAMERTSGNQSAAADLLGINRNTLRKKLIDYRI
jgi:Fis family transcriptional regulator